MGIFKGTGRKEGIIRFARRRNSEILPLLDFAGGLRTRVIQKREFEICRAQNPARPAILARKWQYDPLAVALALSLLEQKSLPNKNRRLQQNPFRSREKVRITRI